MPNELSLPLSTLFGFLLALARVSCVFIFVPIPGLKTGPAAARMVLILAITLSLSGSWPAVDPAGLTAGKLAGWLAWEALLGLGVGLAIAFLTEALGVAAQLISVQSGYGFSSTFDPNTQADSTVLIILSQLLGGLLFFALGLDRQLIAAFAQSLETLPPAAMMPPAVGERVIALGSSMFSTGLRLALPVIGLLALIDIALALIGRLNSHLQLLAITFPAKMMVAMVMLSATLLLYARIYSQDAARGFGLIRSILAP